MDVAGTLVQDCEVCCNPWLLRVTLGSGNRAVSVARATVRSERGRIVPILDAFGVDCASLAARDTTHAMIDTPFVVQKVEWSQFRDPAGHAFFVMVSSLPNGFFTAVPCHVTMRLADHSLIALAATQEEALKQLQTTLAGKTAGELFPAT